MVKFSLRFLFDLNSSNKPIPDPVNKPDIATPTVIKLDKNTSVITTDEAQLGIKPIRLDMKYTKILLS